MKRIGIYFFCVIAIGCITSSILFWENEKSGEISVERTREEQLKQSALKEDTSYSISENMASLSEETMLESIDYSQWKFLAKNEDGYLVIYDCATMRRYDETAILVNNLPLDWQKRLEKGVFFLDEEALYEFLENYSS